MHQPEQQPEFVGRLKEIRDSGFSYKYCLNESTIDHGDHRDGFLLSFSPELLLIHQFDCFTPDGYSIRPITTISDVSIRDSHTFFQRVYESEGLLAGLTPRWTLDLSSMRNAIEGIQRQHRYLNIFEEYEPGEFYASFGRVVMFGEASLLIQRFDSCADWEDMLIHIAYENIREVEFGTRYIDTFTKYLAEPPSWDVSEYKLD